MDKTIFAFIWRHSKRQQLVLLLLTLISFPFLYLSLELPKRIINDAISGEPGMRDFFGLEVGQVGLLAILCGGFLLAVLAQGLMKMLINTRKGVLSERLLRRFRYQLIHRILRFPRPHFQRVSQGELVSMVTAEAEPLGGLMGDLVAQPIFQGGMMLTILGFLFVQNPWLGLAAVALIPLQAWLIPLLQRRINLLNKARVKEVRRLAEEIGESAAGASELRVNGGLRRRLAQVSARLGRLFEIRYRIYRQKFFMKFLNNFITQLTPFFFFSIGGYLAITGELTVGALVAALAAYKDLSAPWKELLTWYNQTQDMGLRWQIITERFMPRDILDEKLFEGVPEDIPHIAGPILMEGVTVRDREGTAVLDCIDLEIQPGATVGIKSGSDEERRAFCELITREVLPASGRVTIAGHALSDLHQAVISARVGHAGPRPYLFSGTVGDNITMGLRTRPSDAEDDGEETVEGTFDLEEARKAGNSTDPHDADWLDPSLAGLEDREGLSAWWMQLTEAMGTDTFLFRRGLDARFDADDHPELAGRLVELRPKIAERLQQKGLSKAVYRFEDTAFNPGLPVAGNLIFATPTKNIMQEELAENDRFHDAMARLGMEAEMMKLGKAVLSTLETIFGSVGTEHPMFRGLNIDAALFEKLIGIARKARDQGTETLGRTERGLLMTVPFRFSADQIGEAFPDKLKNRILEIRAKRRDEMRKMAGELFEPLEEDRFAKGLTVLENALWGKVCISGGAKVQKVRDVVSDVFVEEGLKRLVAELIYDASVGIGGSNLPPVALERMSFVRAAIKKPDVLLLDRALASHDSESRLRMRTRLRALLPETTLIFLEEDFHNPDSFDVFAEIEDGRLKGREAAETTAETSALTKKLRKLERVELFAGLERNQLRLLAYGSQWVNATAGEYLFRDGDPTDGAYVLVKGQATLRYSEAQPEDKPVSVVEPGRMVGDLSVLRGEPRRHDFVAETDVMALRIGAEELRTIVNNDINVATNLLRTVSGYLIEVGGRLRDVRRGVDTDRLQASIGE
ncbi:MAG: ABC transporter transmembrane domain-containing protein [Pseudomonadota bacterium]